MREFFERIDSGAYDGVTLLFVGALLVVLTVWHYVSSHRSKAAFFTAQREAQEAFEKFGRDDVTTQLKVMDALHAWRVWQHRPPPSYAELGDYPSPEEWHAISLLQSLPEERVIQ
jgi:hypothetical protein